MKIKIYKKGEIYDYGFPMPVGETITCYEDYGISIQFNCYKYNNKKYVIIVNVEAKKPGTGKFNQILKDFTKHFKKADIIGVVNVINGGLIKYFKENNIIIYN